MPNIHIVTVAASRFSCALSSCHCSMTSYPDNNTIYQVAAHKTRSMHGLCIGNSVGTSLIRCALVLGCKRHGDVFTALSFASREMKEMD